MDSREQIIKAHKALLASLTHEEHQIFGELTLEHQLFIASLLTRTDENILPDDIPKEIVLQEDIEGLIEHVKENIRRIRELSEGQEEWESWLNLKARIKLDSRHVMDIHEYAQLLFAPYDIKAGNENRKTMQDTAEFVFAGFWATEGYIEPYRYPWQTAMRKILFRGYKLPDVWTPENRRMTFEELPIGKKVYAQWRLDDFARLVNELPDRRGILNPARMLPVLNSYLPMQGSGVRQSHQRTGDHLETLYPSKTKPSRKNRKRLEVLWDCHDADLSIEEILDKCKLASPDLFGHYDFEHFTTGSGNPWSMAIKYKVIPSRKA